LALHPCGGRGLGNGTVSVRLSQLSTNAAACGGFAAVRPAGRRYRSLSGRPQQQWRRRKRQQCHVRSQVTPLNTDLLGFRVLFRFNYRFTVTPSQHSGLQARLKKLRFKKLFSGFKVYIL